VDDDLDRAPTALAFILPGAAGAVDAIGWLTLDGLSRRT
jgi:hypothetical protein